MAKTFFCEWKIIQKAGDDIFFLVFTKWRFVMLKPPLKFLDLPMSCNDSRSC